MTSTQIMHRVTAEQLSSFGKCLRLSAGEPRSCISAGIAANVCSGSAYAKAQKSVKTGRLCSSESRSSARSGLYSPKLHWALL